MHATWFRDNSDNDFVVGEFLTCSNMARIDLNDVGTASYQQHGDTHIWFGSVLAETILIHATYS